MPNAGKGSRDAPEKPHEEQELPPAGRHAKPSLTNPDATPGAGTLPRLGKDDDPVAPPTG